MVYFRHTVSQWFMCTISQWFTIGTRYHSGLVYGITVVYFRHTVSQWYDDAAEEVERDLSLDIQHLEKVKKILIM